jgi:hypothetical protein
MIMIEEMEAVVAPSDEAAVAGILVGVAIVLLFTS